jgi:BlaI family penicillinase repressor
MKKIPKISDSEWKIMKIFWENSPQKSSEIINALSKNSTWSSKTVKSLINRLVNKQALGYEKRGKIYYYYPLFPENECIMAEKKSFAEKLYNGAMKSMIRSFIEEEELSESEINELTELLKKKARKDGNN